MTNSWAFTRILILCTVLLAGILTTLPANAKFEDGVQAYLAQDYDAALAAWRPLAEDGHAEAQFGVGLCYENGRRVERMDMTGPTPQSPHLTQFSTPPPDRPSWRGESADRLRATPRRQEGRARPERSPDRAFPRLTAGCSAPESPAATPLVRTRPKQHETRSIGGRMPTSRVRAATA